jgi:PAS domain S-box-containing protein
MTDPTPTDATGTAANARTVLLVEDEAVIALAEAETLEDIGYTVRTVYTPDEAVEAVRRDSIDLVLMDVDLGPNRKNGIEAARGILKIRDLPVVFLSSHTEAEIVKKTAEVPSYGYVVKGTGQAVLAATLEMAFKLRHAHERLVATNRQLDAILNNAQDLIGRLDRNKVHLYVNRALSEATGIPVRDYVGKTIDELGFPESLVTVWNRAVDTVFENGSPTQIEFSLPTEQGNRIFDCRIAPENVERGEITTVVAISRDVTVSRQARLEHERNEARLEGLLKLTEADTSDFYELARFALDQSAGITGSKVGFINFVSEDETRLTKAVYTSGTASACRLAPETAKLQIQGTGLWSEALRSRTAIVANDFDDSIGLELPQGHPVIRRFLGLPVFDGDRITAVAGLANKETDYDEADVRQFKLYMEELSQIAQRKRAEEELRKREHQLNIILNSTSEMVAYYDTDLRVEWANVTSAKSVGMKTSELLGRHCYELWHQRSEPCPDCPVVAARDTKSAQQAEVTTPDGRRFSIRGYPVLGDDGELTGLVEFGRDVTEKERTEQRLRESIKEKDYLMQELNHRIKNNLAMISSLVNLKDASLGQAVDLSDIRHQINAFMIVHGKLNEATQVSRIQLRPYVEEILQTVFSTYTDSPVRIENRTADIELPTRIAIPLGLIVNEIATNAVKHGFVPGAEARFVVSMNESGNVLSIANSGRPFPEDVDMDSPRTLGLRLISALSRQIRASLTLTRKPHPIFELRFSGNGGENGAKE